ncbi:uncharacterized protein LOC120129325 [Hibiscus syriacus]|uniref:uncharacterized protein LOC120129325 n=1 Tax=Hibiscus syriacus TaxID=106335 RepID=UPI001922E4F9|nr:uncharacterized protein LOC120129325 [Hibiscus syriacus]
MSSSISSLYNPLFSTFVCNFFLLLAANSTVFSLLFFGYHFINGLGFSLSPNWLTFMSAVGVARIRVVVRAYGYRSEGDYGGFLLALEGVLISYLYSIFIVLDTVVSCMFFESCKTGCLVDHPQGRYCYKIEIFAERDGKAFVKKKKRRQTVGLSMLN